MAKPVKSCSTVQSPEKEAAGIPMKVTALVSVAMIERLAAHQGIERPPRK